MVSLRKKAFLPSTILKKLTFIGVLWIKIYITIAYT
jgi:hypothetical protein